MRRVRAHWLRANPGHAAAVVQAAGLISTAVPWLCHDCGRVIYGPSIGTHQKASGHMGRTRLDSTTTSTTKENP